MFYNSLKKNTNEVIQLRWITTITELRQMPYETQNEKIEIAIKLIKLLNWLNYQWLMKWFDLVEDFNEKLYRQALSSAITYARKPDVVVWFIFKLLLILIKELNKEMPKYPDLSTLKECLDSKADEYWVRDFTKFFELELTEHEKKEITKAKSMWELTWSKDVHWKALSFLEELQNGTKVSLTERWDLNKLLNTDIQYILWTKIEANEVEDDLKEIYINLEYVSWRKKRWVIQTILVAVLFNQPYDKYKVLKEAKDAIDVKLNN